MLIGGKGSPSVQIRATQDIPYYRRGCINVKVLAKRDASLSSLVEVNLALGILQIAQPSHNMIWATITRTLSSHIFCDKTVCMT